MKKQNVCIIIFIAALAAGIGALNLFISVDSAVSGRMMEGGKLSTPLLNAMCALLFLEVFVIVMLRKKSAESVADDEE